MKGARASTQEARRLFTRGLELAREGRIGPAADAFAAAAALDDRQAAVFNNLGNARYLQGRLDEAVAAWRRALALNPEDPGLHVNMANALRRQEDWQGAAAALQRAIDLGVELPAVRHNLGRALMKLDRRKEAVAVFRAALLADANNHTAAHLLSALTGETPATAPVAYVTEVFDELAPRFDQHLTEDLGYETPQRLRELFDRLCPPPSPRLRILDLGCGTGLSGHAFADRAVHLTGIDLSAPMLARAQAKGVYDRLYQGEMTAFLDGTEKRFDLFVAADVFCYVGDLAPLFAAVRRRSADGAWFLFSVEAARRDDYGLRPTGRFAHGRRYVERLADRSGFQVRSVTPSRLRRERGAWIEGLLVALRAAASVPETIASAGQGGAGEVIVPVCAPVRRPSPDDDRG